MTTREKLAWANEQRDLGFDVEVGITPEMVVSTIRGFVCDAYENGVNPLPVLRQVYPHLKFDYVRDVTWRDEKPGTDDTRIQVASESYRVAVGACYVVVSWK